MTGYLPIVRWMLILRPAIVTSTLGVAMLVLPRETIDKFPIAVVVFGSYLLTLLYWLTLHISGISRSLLATQIAFDIFIITIIIHYTGGYDSSFVGFYFLSIMCASLFFRRLVTFIYSIAAVVAYVSYLAFFEYLFGSPFLDPAARQGLLLQAFLYAILMLAIGFFSSYYSERLIRKDTALSSALRLLKEARLDTSDILQSMNNGLIAFDRSGRVMYFNQAALSIFQIDQMTGMERYDSMLANRAGKLVDIIRRELTENSSGADEEIEIYGRDGFPIPIGLTTVPLYDTDGGRRGMIVNFKDLTEKQKLLEMVRQSDRMAAIGELSAAIAHEIRNPLAAICNAVELLGEEIEDRKGQVSRLLQVIEKESDRLQRITSEFLKFARMRNPEIIPIELKNAVDEVVLLIENDPRKTEQVAIRNRVSGSQVVYFDPDHLKQLMINVMINSLDALGGQGEIEIGLERKRKAADTFVRLVIADNGPGFPEDVLGSVFEPFFSTKKEGTGLGLALVRKIVVSNRGRVFAKNRKNGGAEIALDIPVNGAENV
ncbi:MAG: two-component system sensor histidine kinase NtrB [Candidatus Latescibacterota bacterium]